MKLTVGCSISLFCVLCDFPHPQAVPAIQGWEAVCSCHERQWLGHQTEIWQPLLLPWINSRWVIFCCLWNELSCWIEVLSFLVLVISRNHSCSTSGSITTSYSVFYNPYLPLLSLWQSTFVSLKKPDWPLSIDGKIFTLWPYQACKSVIKVIN